MADKTAGTELPPRSGMELLRDTLEDKTDNSTALGRMLSSIYVGALSVQGQPPDRDYPVGEYIIHGGRVKFDLRELSDSERKRFFDYISNGKAVPREFATHRVGDELDADGSPKEIKTGLGGVFGDMLSSSKGIPIHYGINIAVGGRQTVCREGGEESLGKKPAEDGQWGHMYIHKDDEHGVMLVGVEGAELHKKNLRSLQGHSVLGIKGEFSAFNEFKNTSKDLHDQQIKVGKQPINIGNDINWATVRITQKSLQLLLANQVDPLAIMYKEHPLSQEAQSNRLEKMASWASEQKVPQEKLQSTSDLINKIFKVERLIRENKIAYIQPLAEFNRAYSDYQNALHSSSSISPDELKKRYTAVIQGLENFKLVTNDANKLLTVEGCIQTMGVIQDVMGRKVRENDLPNRLIRELDTPRKKGLLSSPQNTTPTLSASLSSLFPEDQQSLSADRLDGFSPDYSTVAKRS